MCSRFRHGLMEPLPARSSSFSYFRRPGPSLNNVIITWGDFSANLSEIQ